MRVIKEFAQKYHLSYPFIKFLFVGALNTVFAYSVYSFFIFIGVLYIWASILSTVIGICFNFKTTGSIVFKNNNNKLIFKFFIVYCFTCLINIIFLTFLIKLFGFNDYISGAITVFPIALLSFYLMRKFVFVKSL